MAKTFRPTLFLRTSNKIVALLLRAGVNMGNMTLLTVRGRKSGQPRTTPVALIERDGQRWLIAPYGSVNWVRNLRAAGQATLTRGRRTEQISVAELSAQEAAPILKHALGISPSFLLAYFDVTADSSLADIESEAPRHPVFLVKSQSGLQNTNKNAPGEKAIL
jgi:deazaflavin-dependent oxidoreductase (nitroreductase family)